MAEIDGDNVTLSKDELSALIDERTKAAIADSKMPDDEKKLRKIIRDETSKTISEKLGEFFKLSDDDDDGDGEESGGENDGGEGTGILDSLLKVVKGA